MLEQFQWLPFLVAIALLTLSPGVDTLLVLRNAARGGWREGWMTSLGICSGLFVHATVSAAGLSVILLNSATLFLGLKLAGAAYLAWLGLQSLRAAFRSRAIIEPPLAQAPVAALRALREGLLSNLLNPKPIVFYMALLPQFIDPAHSPLFQSLLMASVHFIFGVLWLGLLACGVQHARQWLARPAVARTLEGVTGGLLVALSARLALNN